VQYPALIPAISDVTCAQNSRTETDREPCTFIFLKMAIVTPTGYK